MINTSEFLTQPRLRFFNKPLFLPFFLHRKFKNYILYIFLLVSFWNRYFRPWPMFILPVFLFLSHDPTSFHRSEIFLRLRLDLMIYSYNTRAICYQLVNRKHRSSINASFNTFFLWHFKQGIKKSPRVSYE